MTAMTVSLPEPIKAWIDAQIRAGRFADGQDYICELIRRDQQRQARLAGEPPESGAPLALSADRAEALLEDMAQDEP